MKIPLHESTFHRLLRVLLLINITMASSFSQKPEDDQNLILPVNLVLLNRYCRKALLCQFKTLSKVGRFANIVPGWGGRGGEGKRPVLFQQDEVWKRPEHTETNPDQEIGLQSNCGDKVKLRPLPKELQCCSAYTLSLQPPDPLLLRNCHFTFT